MLKSVGRTLIATSIQVHESNSIHQTAVSGVWGAEDCGMLEGSSSIGRFIYWHVACSSLLHRQVLNFQSK